MPPKRFSRQKGVAKDGRLRAQYGFQHGLRYAQRLRRDEDLWSRSDTAVEPEVDISTSLKLLSANLDAPTTQLRLKVPLLVPGAAIVPSGEGDGSYFAFRDPPSNSSEVAARFLLSPPSLGGVCDVWPPTLDLHLDTVRCPESLAPFAGSLLKTIAVKHLAEAQRENCHPAGLGMLSAPACLRDAYVGDVIELQLHGLHSMRQASGSWAYFTQWSILGDRGRDWSVVSAILEDFRNQLLAINAEVFKRPLFTLESAHRREPLSKRIFLRRFTGELPQDMEAARQELNVTGTAARGVFVGSLRLEFAQWTFEVSHSGISSRLCLACLSAVDGRWFWTRMDWRVKCRLLGRRCCRRKFTNFFSHGSRAARPRP